MPTTRTYSPLPPMIPAGDIFCANPCGPREPNPCPHTYGVRVSLCAAFATEPCRPAACISAAPFRHTHSHPRPRPTTVWRNLQQYPRTPSSYTFSAKEKDSETGFSYFGSRYYSSDLSIWLSVDPMSGKYPSLSPYVYCADNPVRLVDPNGEDWYEVENTETHEMEIKWTDHKSQADMDAAGVKGTYLGEAFMDIKGSRSEKLGAGNNLFNEGAVLAKATVYGPSGKDDIKEYDAFTMSSDFSKYGAIADGDYTVNYRDPGKSGPLSSNWAVNDAEPVNCLDGKNPNPKGYSPTQKNGIYIHRSNNNGDMLPSGHPVSTGCIIIVPSRTGKNGWNEFNQQLSGVSSFKMRLKRD